MKKLTHTNISQASISPRNISQRNISKNNGAVLVMSLMMLFVLTLIGVSSINTTTLEEKMSGNTRNRQLAFQSAETAIRAAERKITDDVTNPTALFPDTQTTAGYYALGNGPAPSQAIDSTWWTTSGNTSITYTETVQDIATAPKYTIEYIGETTQEEATDINIYGGEENTGGQGSIHTFRITARGTGLTNNAVVVIQSYFGKRI